MADHNQSFEGGCTCGHVRYEMTATPLIVHGCHCRWCQRQSGGAFAINALIEADNVIVTHGEPVDVLVTSPSGTGQNIVRCPKCMVAVWSNYLIFQGNLGKHVRFVKVGTLDDPDRFPPDVHIFTSTKQPWLELPADANVFEEYYSTEKTWSEGSKRRLKALKAKVGS